MFLLHLLLHTISRLSIHIGHLAGSAHLFFVFLAVWISYALASISSFRKICVGFVQVEQIQSKSVHVTNRSVVGLLEMHFYHSKIK